MALLYFNPLRRVMSLAKCFHVPLPTFPESPHTDIPTNQEETMKYFGSWLLRGCLATLLLVGSARANASPFDVTQYAPAAKGQLFDQFTSGAPTLSATGFMFQASVTGTGSNTILSATVQVPGGSNVVLSLTDPETSKFEFQSLFTSQQGMDAVFTNGTYLMTISTT